jgi:hypothetical protein
MRRALAGAIVLLSIAIPGAFPQGVPSQSGKASRDSSKASHDAHAAAQDSTRHFEIYGFAQGDAIGDFKSNNPDWFDVNRPSRLPATPDEFGHNGHSWLSARQSQFGTKASIPTGNGNINIVFDWDLFGVGLDAGQTTIRPRHMYGQWGNFGGGQLESPFMDINVFPNILEYWGPSGMLFFRNVQLFWQPVHREDGTRVTFAIERPGASGDLGVVADRIELQNIKPRYPAPDISGEYRIGGKFGYAKLGAIVRWLRWDDVTPNDPLDLSGGTTGWGVSFSTGLNLGARDVLHLQTVVGAGVENYFNDAPVDVGANSHPSTTRPVTGKALGDLGLVAYLDHRWNSRFTSALGYSRVDIDNSDLQLPTAFKSGQYASGNLLFTPVTNVMFGGELQYAHRDNFGGGFHADDFRLQVSLKYSFSQKFGGGTHEPITAQDK